MVCPWAAERRYDRSGPWARFRSLLAWRVRPGSRPGSGLLGDMLTNLWPIYSSAMWLSSGSIWLFGILSIILKDCCCIPLLVPVFLPTVEKRFMCRVSFEHDLFCLYTFFFLCSVTLAASSAVCLRPSAPAQLPNNKSLSVLGCEGFGLSEGGPLPSSLGP